MVLAVVLVVAVLWELHQATQQQAAQQLKEHLVELQVMATLAVVDFAAVEHLLAAVAAVLAQ
jgi:anti-anti-sigma regulatory factor